MQLVLGQGILFWELNDGDIRHPIVSQRLQISFDPFAPEFSISETAQPPELLRPLLSVSQDVAAQTIQQADEEIAKQDLDLLDIDKIEGPLRRVAAACTRKVVSSRMAHVQTNRRRASNCLRPRNLCLSKISGFRNRTRLCP